MIRAVYKPSYLSGGYKPKYLYVSGTESMPCVFKVCSGTAVKGPADASGAPVYSCPECRYEMRNPADMPGG